MVYMYEYVLLWYARMLYAILHTLSKTLVGAAYVGYLAKSKFLEANFRILV